MLKPLHNGHHDMSSLVICCKGVKSILVLSNPDTEVWLKFLSCGQGLHECWLIPSSPGECLPSGLLPEDASLLLSATLPCAWRGSNKRKDLKENMNPYLLCPWCKSRLCLPVAGPRMWGAGVAREAVLGAGSHPDFSVFRWS